MYPEKSDGQKKALLPASPFCFVHPGPCSVLHSASPARSGVSPARGQVHEYPGQRAFQPLKLRARLFFGLSAKGGETSPSTQRPIVVLLVIRPISAGATLCVRCLAFFERIAPKALARKCDGDLGAGAVAGRNLVPAPASAIIAFLIVGIGLRAPPYLVVEFLSLRFVRGGYSHLDRVFLAVVNQGNSLVAAARTPSTVTLAAPVRRAFAGR